MLHYGSCINAIETTFTQLFMSFGGHLLGKGWRIRCFLVFCHFSMWCPVSDVILDLSILIFAFFLTLRKIIIPVQIFINDGNFAPLNFSQKAI